MELNDKLTNFFNETIYNWVAKNFGTQEAEDPSWSIKDLSAELSSKLLTKVRGQEVPVEKIKKELTLMLKAGCDVASERNDIDTKIRELGGDVICKENEGIKTLAYKICGEYRADHSYWVVLVPKDKVAELAGYLNTRENVLRYLLINKDERSE